MKTLKDELKELQILLNNPTPENEMLYQRKFIEIKDKFSSKEDANMIADFVLNGYKQINEGLAEIEEGSKYTPTIRRSKGSHFFIVHRKEIFRQISPVVK